MKRTLWMLVFAILAVAVWLMAQPVGDPLIEGFRMVEVASVSDAMEQLYGQKNYMSHEMRPLAAAKFAGPAVTVLLKKEEHKEGSAASAGMLDAIDNAKPGSVYVMVLEDGADYAGMGGLMATAMKYRGLTGAIIDGGVRDTPQIRKLQFPVFIRGVVPRPASITIGLRASMFRSPAPERTWLPTISLWPTRTEWWWCRARMPKRSSKRPRLSTIPSTACCRSSRSSSRSKKPWPSSAESKL